MGLTADIIFEPDVIAQIVEEARPAKSPMRSIATRDGGDDILHLVGLILPHAAEARCTRPYDAAAPVESLKFFSLKPAPHHQRIALERTHLMTRCEYRYGDQLLSLGSGCPIAISA